MIEGNFQNYSQFPTWGIIIVVFHLKQADGFLQSIGLFLIHLFTSCFADLDFYLLPDNWQSSSFEDMPRIVFAAQLV